MTGHSFKVGRRLLYYSSLDAMAEDIEEHFILEVENEKTQKEIDEEIKRKKEKQRFLDDVGVMVAMISITLIAVLVVVIKVLIVHTEVTHT